MELLILLIGILTVETLLSHELASLTEQRGPKYWLLGFGTLLLPVVIYLLLFRTRAMLGGTILALILGLCIYEVLEILSDIYARMR